MDLLRPLFPILTSALALSSCGQKKTNVTTTTSSLEGIWKDACTSDNETPPAYSREILSIQGSTAARSFEIYSDAACSNLTEGNKILFTFVATEGSANSKFDITITGAKAVVNTDDLVKTYNSTSAFGYNTWAKGVEMDVAGKTNTTTTDTPNSSEKTSIGFPAGGEKVYDIFKVTGTNLVFGDCKGVANCTDSDSSRPTTLDAKSPFIKQ